MPTWQRAMRKCESKDACINWVQKGRLHSFRLASEMNVFHILHSLLGSSLKYISRFERVFTWKFDIFIELQSMRLIRATQNILTRNIRLTMR